MKLYEIGQKIRILREEKKLTQEERAEEIIDRFFKINRDLETNDTSGTNPYISKRGAILCAIELVKENIFISGKGYGAEWYNRYSYWNKILQILTDKLL